MKKSTVLVLSLLVLSIFSFSLVFAEESTITKTRTANMMEKHMIEDASERPIKPMIYGMHFRGAGLIVNPSDLNDFSKVALLGAKVSMPNGSIIGRGAMKTENQKYWLANIRVNNDVYTADVYNTAKSKVGSLSLSKKQSTDTNWHGTLELDGKSWHIYLLGVSRGFNAEELADKVKSYCKENPADATCKSVAGYLCKDNPERCNEKIMDFCEDHPDDSRCKFVLERFCKEHPEEDRCHATSTTIPPTTSTTETTEATTSIQATTTVEGSSTSTTSIQETTTVGA